MRYRISRKAKKEYACKVEQIDAFCAEHGIDRSCSGDSCYFIINGQKYRVSNHSIEASNRHAVSFFGEVLREKYHPDKREEDVIYIHAGKTRSIDIYTDLADGRRLDGRGNRI